MEKELDYNQPIEIESSAFSIRNYQLETFSKIIQMLSCRNIDLILVFAPITEMRYNSYSNIDYFNNKMQAFGTYLNFNEIMSLNDSLHFYDSHHLNQKGVEIFNSKLIDFLKREHPNL